MGDLKSTAYNHLTPAGVAAAVGSSYDAYVSTGAGTVGTIGSLYYHTGAEAFAAWQSITNRAAVLNYPNPIDISAATATTATPADGETLTDAVKRVCEAIPGITKIQINLAGA